MTESSPLRLTPLNGSDSKQLGDIVQTNARQAWEPYRDASVKSEEIGLDGLLSLVDTVAQERMARNEQLLDAYQHDAIDPFDPALIDETRLVVGPLVERSGQGELIIDGGHRLLLARQLGLQTVRALVITSPRELPGYASHPVSLVDIGQSAATLPPKHTHDGLHSPNPLFRPGALIVEQTTKIVEARMGLRK